MIICNYIYTVYTPILVELGIVYPCFQCGFATLPSGHWIDLRESLCTILLQAFHSSDSQMVKINLQTGKVTWNSKNYKELRRSRLIACGEGMTSLPRTSYSYRQSQHLFELWDLQSQRNLPVGTCPSCDACVLGKADRKKKREPERERKKNGREKRGKDEKED